jgi:hypothetical protein
MRSLYPWPLFPSDNDSRATRSLSLQFSVQEWIATFDGIAAVEEKIAEPHLLTEEVQKLLLFSLDSPFSAKPGTLDKLCFYVHKLQDTYHKWIKENRTESLLDQMEEDLFALRAHLNAWKKGPVQPSHISDTVHEVCLRLRHTLIEFFHALIPFFEEAKTDENVLFYLIENQADINQILQNPKNRKTSVIEHETLSFKTLQHLFCHLYPSGPAHLRTILYEGYTRRGFTEFYAQHKTVIESIEWLADPCCAQVNTSN